MAKPVFKFLARAGKAVGKIALGAAETRYPFLAPLVDMISEQIDRADGQSGLSGAQKKEHVLGQIDVNGETVLQWIRSAGLDVSDQAAFFEGTSSLIDAIHKIKKSTVQAGAMNGPLTVRAGMTLHLEDGRIVAVSELPQA